MERVYLLLRNNEQTGPFTIGELLQQQLKPSDMIWIEGKSTAWTYLSELELIPFTITPDAVQKNQTTSSDEIERKAEELRQKVLASAPKTYFPNQPVEIETYASPFKQPEDEIQFVDHRRERRVRKNTVIGEMLLTCFVIGLFMVGIYKGKSFLGVKKAVQTTEATKLNLDDEHSARKSKPTIPLTIAVPDTINKSDSMRRHDSAMMAQASKPKPALKRIFVDSISTKATIPIVVPPVAQDEKKKETKAETAIPVPQQIPAKKQTAITSKADSSNAKAEKKEEKKGFLRGLFKKKKKDEDNTPNDNQ